MSAVLTGTLLALALLTACGPSPAPEAIPTATAVSAGISVASASPSPPVPSGPGATEAPTATAPSGPPDSVSTVAPRPSPSPAPAPTAPSLSARDLASQLAGEAMNFLGTFTRDVSPRASATEQERAAAEFLKARFEDIGYETLLQPLEVEQVEARVSVSAGEPDAFDVRGFRISRSPIGEATGLLVDVGGAFEEDLPSGGLDGKIALVQRGTITFEEKITRVAEAGAVAAIVYNNLQGPFRGTLTSQGSIPAIAVPRATGQELLRRMLAGDVEATVSVASVVRDSRNVIAEKPGTDPDGGVVVLGGHYDTVPDVPGANDNGSGIATLMAVAREVWSGTYPFTLRFIAFGSEEIGLVGSRFYVESLEPDELQDLVAMLNFDALGTGPVAGILGDTDLAEAVLSYGRANGIEVERRLGLSEGTSSDHTSFQDAGVPALFFLADDFSRIHTTDDRLEFIQPELLGNPAALAVRLLDILAQR